MDHEQTLIQRALTANDPGAFGCLVKIHQGKIRSLLVRLTMNYDLANDLAQETFIGAFRNIATYSGKGSFAGWLYRIAYNAFLQHSRSERTRLRITDNYLEQQEILAENYDAISVDQIDLEKAVSLLTFQSQPAHSGRRRDAVHATNHR